MPLRVLRVLIADDDAEVRGLVSFLLGRDEGVLLIGEAVDGETALVLVGQQLPDLVLMDVLMPGIGGLEATRRIKRDWPATKVLVMTSLPADETRHAAFAHGADSFLTKQESDEVAACDQGDRYGIHMRRLSRLR